MSDEELKEYLAVVMLMEEEKYDVAGYAMYFMTEEQKQNVYVIYMFRAGIRFYMKLKACNSNAEIILKEINPSKQG